MNVLSLCDGLSGARIALDKLGIKPNKYYASEIDKWATMVSEKNYPDIIRLGDMTKWRTWDIDWESIDLIVAGFPCQSWSMAGEQLGDRDERGALFWEVLDINKCAKSKNPSVKFLMENVKMKKEFEQYITHHTIQALGPVNKYLINSALVSAQNRQRYYWTNIDGVEQPEDKGILLKDILECDYVDRKKSHCIDANYHKGGNLKSYFEKGRRQLAFSRPCEPKEFNKNSTCHHAATATDISGNESIKRVYAETGKAPTLTTMQGGHREPKVLLREKSKTVRSSGRNSYDRHEWDSISDCHYRKLTPLECERLQTIPDNYTLVINENGKQVVSNTQRYKMLGNGFTIDVIAHILKQHFGE